MQVCFSVVQPFVQLCNGLSTCMNDKQWGLFSLFFFIFIYYLYFSNVLGGQLLVIHHTDNSSLLLWKSALAKIQQALCSDTWTTLQYMKEAGFELEVDHFSLSWKMKKEHYFNGIRSRMFSFFEIFTDDEIEEGLKELSVKLPQEKEYTIEINDVFLIINAKIK